MPRGNEECPTKTEMPSPPNSSRNRQTLAEAYPDIAKQWHPTKNGSLTPDLIDAYSSRSVWWKCSKGHESKAPIYNRTRRGMKCGRCRGYGVPLAERAPSIAAEWHPDLNGELTPQDITAGTRKHKIWWVCPEGHEPYQKTPHQRVSHQQGCPECTGTGKKRSGNLRERWPRLADEFDSKKNGTTPEKVAHNSTKKFFWRCINGHTWKASIKDRSSARSGCPKCTSNQRPPLSEEHPELVAEWNERKNGLIDDYTAGSTEVVHWICSEDSSHQWKARIANRTGPGGTGCPICKGKHGQLVMDIYPHFAELWDDEANGGPMPEDITIGSGTKAIWQCEQGHRWESPVMGLSSLADTGEYCQVCSPNRNLDTFRYFVSMYAKDFESMTKDDRKNMLKLAGAINGYGQMRTIAEAILAGDLNAEELERWSQFQPSEVDFVLAEHDPGQYQGRNFIPTSVRRAVYKRDGHKCLSKYCRVDPNSPNARLSIDHRQAVAWGGTDEVDNLYTLCLECNMRKGTLTWTQFQNKERAYAKGLEQLDNDKKS